MTQGLQLSLFSHIKITNMIKYEKKNSALSIRRIAACERYKFDTYSYITLYSDINESQMILDLKTKGSLKRGSMLLEICQWHTQFINVSNSTRYKQPYTMTR
jgi:hypothetical protein